MATRLRRWFTVAIVVVMAFASTGCGTNRDGGQAQNPDATTTTEAAGEMALHPASYDLVSGSPQRFIAGVSFANGELLSFGTVTFSFHYLGTREEPLNPPRPGPSTDAVFLPVPGQDLGNESGPRRVEPSMGRGVYGAYDVVFDEAGFWRVSMQAGVDGETLQASGAFGVNPTHQAPAPGDPAPQVAEPVPGAPGVAPTAVDSRARDGNIPDPHLHATTVAAALQEGKPVMVVVATPVYCRSRFCGPITDAIADMALEYQERMAFVHIEVWEDFEEQKVNPAARAWMSKGASEDLQEPWVYLVGADGVIKARWDNVATEAELRAGITSVLA